MATSNPDLEKLSNRIATWLSITSTFVALLLSIVTFFLDRQLQKVETEGKQTAEKADRLLREFETQRRLKQTDYELVAKNLPNLAQEDAANRTLKINFITLILGLEEAEKLFAGLKSSENQELKSIANTGNRIVQAQRRVENATYARAFALERQGFEALIQGDYDKAIAAFAEAEANYPQFHSVYEIANLLRQRRNELNDVDKRKAILQEIIEKYSWKAPPDAIERLKELSR